MQELAEEGVVQLFRPQDGSQPIVGVVGTLQLDVLLARLAAEYGVGIGFEPVPYALARWVTGEKALLARFTQDQRTAMADDVDGDPVYLASSPFMLRRTAELHAGLTFRDIQGRAGGRGGCLICSQTASSPMQQCFFKYCFGYGLGQNLHLTTLDVPQSSVICPSRTQSPVRLYRGC